MILTDQHGKRKAGPVLIAPGSFQKILILTSQPGRKRTLAKRNGTIKINRTLIRRRRILEKENGIVEKSGATKGRMEKKTFRKDLVTKKKMNNGTVENPDWENLNEPNLPGTGNRAAGNAAQEKAKPLFLRKF
jgi:hypothetical protein